MEKKEIQIPGSLADMTLKQYQDIIQITKEFGESSELVDKKIVQYFTGDDMEAVEDMPMVEYDLILLTIKKCLGEKPEFKNIITVNGVTYGFIPNLKKISAAEYIDLDKYMPVLKNWHKSMAVLYRPIVEVKKVGWFRKKFFYDIDKYEKIDKYTGTSEHSDNMLNMSAADAIGSTLFFWTLSKQLLTHSQSCLEKVLKKRLSPQERSLLENIMDGIKASMLLLEETYLNSMPF